MRAYVQDRGQLIGKISGDRATDERLGGGQQGTVARKPSGRGGPQAIGSETDDLAKSVETAAMRVAGQVVEFFELSEDGEVDFGAEGPFQIGKGCDSVVSSSFRKESDEKARGRIML